METLTLHDIRMAKLMRQASPLPQPLQSIGRVVQIDTTQCVMRFSPEDARQLLQNVHPKQRKVRKERVKQLLRTMQSNGWHEPPYTFDSIAFDIDGRLCNGLHRLTALAQHDKPLSFYVIIGVKSPEDMPLPEGDSNIPRPGSFVAGIERNEWATISYLANCVFGHHNIARIDVQSIYPLFAEALAAIPRITTHPPSAPIRAAFVFSYAAADYNAKQHIAEQWRAYCCVDVASMCVSTGRLYKKLNETSGSKGFGKSDRDFRFESAIYAIRNPDAVRISRQSGIDQEVHEWVMKHKEVQR